MIINELDVVRKCEMKIQPISKVSELLYWSYANLAMAEKAVHDGDAK